ncbi:zinc-dependent alcohol dehydrogenase family protein [Streptomyces parvus]|uniref:zinc-dependent alcohol dehydrogenase family protein n=1 Tax=Streptomyces parvus TaxID=66428 RepID=UPI003802627D
MRATLMYAAGDVRVETVPDPKIQAPTDAVVRILLSCVCGSDLWPYKGLDSAAGPLLMGHEFLGVVEETGSAITSVKPGEVVLAPFLWCDNTCDFCQEGLHNSCRHGGPWGANGVDGGQGEYARVPHADGTLVKLPVPEDSDLLPGLLTLSDVLCTGYHAAHSARVQPGDTVAVVGDGAVGQGAVISAKKLGAERIILMGRHSDRTDLGRDFGATDVVAERGAEAVARVRDLTGGDGVAKVLECVGTKDAVTTAFGIARNGGTISRVGVPQYAEVPFRFPDYWRNITLTGGIAPARAYIERLMPDVLDGTIDPGRVFDRTVTLDDIADGYRAMNDREALKVLVRP